jgi:hypothetical protein
LLRIVSCSKIWRQICEICDGDEYGDHYFRMCQLVVKYKLTVVSEETIVAFMLIVIVKEWSNRIFPKLDNVPSEYTGWHFERQHSSALYLLYLLKNSSYCSFLQHGNVCKERRFNCEILVLVVTSDRHQNTSTRTFLTLHNATRRAP